MSTAVARKPGLVKVRDVSLYVDVVGHGYPLLLMHGGPGVDHWSLQPTFRRLEDQFTLVFYDHRCNGRSGGVPVSSMTWHNLTADADALREHLGFDRWAVLGHSFGGNVALEYALRYPNRLSHLVLLDSGGDSRWPLENAVELTRRRHGDEQAELVRRWFHGDFKPREMFPILMRIGPLYSSHPSLRATLRELAAGEWRMKARAEPLIFAGRQLAPGWNVMGRLGEIKVPSLVLAGQDDFLYPPESQAQLTSGIPNACLQLIEGAGHNPQDERPLEVIRAVRDFLAVASQPRAAD